MLQPHIRITLRRNNDTNKRPLRLQTLDVDPQLQRPNMRHTKTNSCRRHPFFPVTPDAFKIDEQLSKGIFYSSGIAYTGLDFFQKRACLAGIETPRFKSYWEDRLRIAKNSFEDFEALLDDVNHKVGKHNEAIEEGDAEETDKPTGKDPFALAMLEKRKKKLGY